MIKFLSLFVLVSILVSCKTESLIVGNWEEINYKSETLQFHENGIMEFKQKGEKGNSPINFKYELVDSQENYIIFNMLVYNDTTFIKQAKHKATFNNKNTITVDNLDFPDVKSKTYVKQK